MKLIRIVSKDFKVFFRDFRSFLLLFITPIVLVILISVAFLGSSPTNIPISICSEGETELYTKISNIISESGTYEIISVMFVDDAEECAQILQSNLATSFVRAGMIIPGANELETVKIKIIIDNSKPVSSYIESYFRILFDDISNEIIVTSLKNIAKDINLIKERSDEFESELIVQRNRIVSLKRELASVSTQLDVTYNNLERIDRDIKNVKNQIDDSVFSIRNIETGIDNSISTVDSAIFLVSSLPGNSTNTILNQLRDLKSDLLSHRQSLENDRIRLDATRNTIQNIDILSQLSEIRSVRLSVDNAITELGYVETGINDLISDFRSLRSYLDDTALNAPESAVPIDSEIEYYFSGLRFLDFVFPSIMIMVIMLISTFISSVTLIRQRSNGIIDRFLITPNGFRNLIIEKLFINFLLSLLTVPFILAIGFGVFGISFELISFVGIIVSLSLSIIIFVSIGLIIAGMSRTETTAILISILVVIPMIFLSGIFIPFEAFPAAVKDFASNLPMIISVRSMEDTLFYKVSFETLLVQNAKLIAYIIALVSLATLLLRRELSR